MNFSDLFAQAITPVTLISGVGLLLLSMVNRYSHITSKARSLYKELKQNSNVTSKETVQTLLRRCTQLRNAIICLLMTVALSGSMIALLVIAQWTGLHLDILMWTVLLLAILFLLIALFLFARDFKVSLQALRIDLGKYD